MFKKNSMKFIAFLIVAIIASLLLIRPLPGAQPVMGNAGVSLPIIMYHSILKDEARQGRYVVSPDVIDSDFAYLQKCGYRAVTSQQIIDYVTKNGELPEKPVFITFDDGYYNNYLYLPPILEKYNFSALISVVGEYSERFTKTKDPNPNYGHMSWEEVGDIEKSPYVEIGNHSYMLHHQDPRRGASQKSGESVAVYQKAVGGDTMRMQSSLSSHCGFEPTVYTYPYGQISESSDDVMRKLGFSMTLSCYERVTVLTDNPACLFSMGRYNRAAGQSTEEFMAKLHIK